LGLERARPRSPFWASLIDFRFLLIGSEPFHCIIIVCSIYVIAVDWLVLLLRIVYRRPAEEVEFMLHSTALPEGYLPPTLVRGWFGDAMAILGQAYRRPCIRSFSECNTSLISAYMQHQ
jgi:hypothetical protein